MSISKLPVQRRPAIALKLTAAPASINLTELCTLDKPLAVQRNH
ncbi:MAG: hypothetical protein AAFY30_10960 [Cyanobacteria bacterium J06642_12]